MPTPPSSRESLNYHRRPCEPHLAAAAGCSSLHRYLDLQAVDFRGRDESFSSLNYGNFLESLGIVTFWNEKVAKIKEKTLKNATYPSPRIQKEILHVFSAKVKKAIWEEISDAKFCIIVDEARDESMKEQMTVVFRYVDAEGFIYKIFKGKDMMEQATCERNEQLKVANANEIARLIDLEELETGRGLNQIGTLQRPVETHWSSHFRSVSSLLRMFTSTVEVLLYIIDDAIDGEHQVEAESAYDGLTSFEFVFFLHLEEETMEITDKLCQALQSQSQEILNVMHLVSSSKALIQKFRNDGWDGLLATVISFCEKHYIDVLDMNACYVARYDKQVLENELYHFEHNVVRDPKFKKLKSLSELCQWLVRTRNSEYYKLVYRIVRLVLTLPISTATTERAFSIMKVVKTNLRNKMENDFLTDSLLLYIEKDMASTFSLDSIIDDFEDLKQRRVPFS
ncbi:uncharacterized protein LOC142616575 [Castanea sativa]|uniref:uncharacterized protein LOC142616575 n=1 Tax=Castanea sativa TaxID=21020 RepID=UPI003F64F758